ncbi:HNH endonuclease [Acetobacter ascendens]|nr:HNH endonuclease [Acetobacter ascendens]
MTGADHIDSHNGFLLSPNIDHLFDCRYITFSDEGAGLVAAQVNKN